MIQCCLAGIPVMRPTHRHDPGDQPSPLDLIITAGHYCSLGLIPHPSDESYVILA